MQSSARLPLLPLALSHVLLFVGGLLAFRVLAPGSPLPTPLDSVQAVQQFHLAHGGAVRVAAFLQFASAVPLSLFAVALFRRVHVGGAGEWVGLLGGCGASLLLSLTGISAWVASDPGVAASGSTVRAIQLLTFALGGPGFAVLFGLLAAGVVAAGGASQRLPRWLIWLGVVCAACGLLSALTLLSIRAAVFIPLTRFLGFLWLIGTGWALRHPQTEEAR